MTRSQLIRVIAWQTNQPVSAVEETIHAMVDIIGDTLKRGEKVTIVGLGRFEMRHRKTKYYTNPKTKVSSQLEPTSIPCFKVSGLLKQRIAEASDKK